MAVAKISVPNFTLQSSWTCYFKYHGTQSYGSWAFKNAPGVASVTKTFQYSLPSGANIKSAKVYLKVNNPYTGISFLKVGGNSNFSVENGSRVYAVELASTTANLDVQFEYKANGAISQDTNLHWGTLELSSIFLEIDYDAVVVQAETQSKQIDTFSVPPQSVCVYDQTDGAIFLFDGVAKIQHSLTLDIQEEPDSKKKNQYTNNARNEPDKLTLDVIMSDVYTDGGEIITRAEDDSAAQAKAGQAASGYLMNKYAARSSWTRSEAAFHTLQWLKSQRRLLSVITPQYVHVDMLLGSVTVNQDDTSPFGWQGQLVFQHAYEPKEEKKNNSTRTTDTSVDVPDASVSTTVVGKDFIPASGNGDTKGSTPAATTAKKVTNIVVAKTNAKTTVINTVN